MPRKARGKFEPGHLYHIYNRGNRKELIFEKRSDREYFLRKAKIKSKTSMCNIDIVGYCLMDNHYHLLLRQRGSISISKYMQCLITSYTQYFNCKYGYVGHVFQGRYQSKKVINNLYVRRLLKYFENNPLEAMYMKNPDHYGWLKIPSGTVPSRD